MEVAISFLCFTTFQEGVCPLLITRARSLDGVHRTFHTLDATVPGSVDDLSVSRPPFCQVVLGRFRV